MESLCKCVSSLWVSRCPMYHARRQRKMCVSLTSNTRINLHMSAMSLNHLVPCGSDNFFKQFLHPHCSNPLSVGFSFPGSARKQLHHISSNKSAKQATWKTHHWDCMAHSICRRLCACAHHLVLLAVTMFKCIQAATSKSSQTFPALSLVLRE